MDLLEEYLGSQESWKRKPKRKDAILCMEFVIYLFIFVDTPLVWRQRDFSPRSLVAAAFACCLWWRSRPPRIVFILFVVFKMFFSFLFPKAIESPVRTNQIPRQIPEQSFFTKPVPGIIMGGILPFGCIFIQLFFILNSIWYPNDSILWMI